MGGQPISVLSSGATEAPSIVAHSLSLRGWCARDGTLAHEALREAMANLCVHTDYSEEASLLVTKYPDKIILSIQRATHFPRTVL